MSTFLPKEVREGLDLARKTALRKSSRLSVRVGDEVLPILGMRDNGFTVDIENAPNLRGLIDIYDGPRHLYQALIVACDEEAGQLHYEFKRATRPEDHPATDYVRMRPEIAGLLT